MSTLLSPKHGRNLLRPICVLTDKSTDIEKCKYIVLTLSSNIFFLIYTDKSNEMFNI